MDFEDIRSYRDNEVKDVINRLVSDANFLKFVGYVMGPDKVQSIVANKDKINTIHDFQYSIVREFLESLESKIASECTLIGVENISKEKSSLFLTNHRDIILDSALLNHGLFRNNIDTTEIAIGNNLLIYPWIADLVRLNKSFIVRRDISAKELLLASQKLSAYILDTLQNRKQSIWMAQREGRAKDSNDRTQPSVLKMLIMSGEGSVLDRILALNITPVAICYEYDTCDYLKAKEFQQKRDDANYKKQPGDDLANMKIGLLSPKGRIIFNAAKPISTEDLKPLEGLNRNEQLVKVAELIDHKIFASYRFFPINYVAYDCRFGGNTFANKYTEEEKQKTLAYFDAQIAKIELENKDEAFLRSKILEMYSNPLVNYLSIK